MQISAFGLVFQGIRINSPLTIKTVSAPQPGSATGNEPSSNLVSLVPDNPDWLGLVRVTANHGEGCSVVSKTVDKHARRRVDVSAVQISSDGSAWLTLDRRYSRATLASCPQRAVSPASSPSSPALAWPTGAAMRSTWSRLAPWAPDCRD